MFSFTSTSSYPFIIIPNKKAYMLNMYEPLEQFVKSRKFIFNVNKYLHAFKILNRLRNDALFNTKDQEQLTKLMEYFK